MTDETILTDLQLIEICQKYGPFENMDLSRAIERAVLQSPEVQRLKAIETAAGKVLSLLREDEYIVLTVHLDALRAAMEQQK